MRHGQSRCPVPAGLGGVSQLQFQPGKRGMGHKRRGLLGLCAAGKIVFEHPGRLILIAFRSNQHGSPVEQRRAGALVALRGVLSVAQRCLHLRPMTNSIH